MEEFDMKQLMAIALKKKFVVIAIVAAILVVGLIYTVAFAKPKIVEPEEKLNQDGSIVLEGTNASASVLVGEIPEKEVRVVVNPTTGEPGLNIEELISEKKDRKSAYIETYCAFAKSNTIMEEVRDRIGPEEIGLEDLMTHVKIFRVGTSDIIQVTAYDADAEFAEKIVKHMIDVFELHLKEIYNVENIMTVIKAPTKTIVENGEEIIPVNHKKNMIMTLIIGVFAAGAYLMLCVCMDNTVKNAEEIEALLNVKNLNSIPLDRKNKEELVTAKATKSITAEAFRTLRTNVQVVNTDKKSQVILVTSSVENDGKTYVSANLAASFAQIGKKVIIVDADLRKNRQAEVFDVKNAKGFSNYVMNKAESKTESEYIKKTKIENLDIMTAGTELDNPAELLSSEKIEKLVEFLKKQYDVVIFDGAPILPVTDSLLLAKVVGNVILVATSFKTKKEELAQAKASIENVNGKVIGSILNKVDITFSQRRSYNYYSKDEK